jgi:hypothetical protein
MLRSLKDIEQYTVAATDGDIGRVINFLLDDEHWIVRYLVVDTSVFNSGRLVLISPVFFRQVEWSSRRFYLELTMDKVRNSPSVDAEKPISREHERDYYRYYGYPHYWGESGLLGSGANPALLANGKWDEAPTTHTDADSSAVHLRSAMEVRGYHIQGIDEAIGHVEDFVVDDETWDVRYLVIDTSNWWFGKKVLVAPHWASSISWEEGNVYVDMSRQAIKDCPEWNATAPVNREYETRLYDYYGRPVYWNSDHRLEGTRHSQRESGRLPN